MVAACEAAGGPDETARKAPGQLARERPAAAAREVAAVAITEKALASKIRIRPEPGRPRLPAATAVGVPPSSAIEPPRARVMSLHSTSGVGPAR